MNVIYAWLCALACVNLFSGCATTKDLSKIPFIHGQVNSRQPIKGRCILMSGQKAWNDTSNGHESWFRGAPYQLYDYDESSNSWRKNGWVPKGTEIEIHSVELHETFETTYIDVLGTIFLPDEHSPKEFWYSWMSVGSARAALKRAPWENSDVPERRYLKNYSF